MSLYFIFKYWDLLKKTIRNLFYLFCYYLHDVGVATNITLREIKENSLTNVSK